MEICRENGLGATSTRSTVVAEDVVLIHAPLQAGATYIISMDVAERRVMGAMGRVECCPGARCRLIISGTSSTSRGD